nr:hypothetical protein Iba_chr03bCG12770 [Ipomoea batatas]
MVKEDKNIGLAMRRNVDLQGEIIGLGKRGKGPSDSPSRVVPGGGQASLVTPSRPMKVRREERVHEGVWRCAKRGKEGV